jgi:hypothetical protein
MNAPMTPDRIIENLTQLNEYRRGSRGIDYLKPSCGEIGITIECAIAYIREHESLKKADSDDGK